MTNWTFRETRALYEAAEEKPRLSKAVVRAIRRHHQEGEIVEKIARLQKFVGVMTGTAFIWGQRDCSLMLADWLVMNGHADPAAHLRGTYDTKAACRDVIVAAGGLVPLVAACASRAGLTPTLEPRFGAVAVIGAARDQTRQWGAIWDGSRWLVLWQGQNNKNQFVPFMAKPLAMWSV